MYYNIPHRHAVLRYGVARGIGLLHHERAQVAWFKGWFTLHVSSRVPRFTAQHSFALHIAGRTFYNGGRSCAEPWRICVPFIFRCMSCHGGGLSNDSRFSLVINAASSWRSRKG